MENGKRTQRVGKCQQKKNDAPKIKVLLFVCLFVLIEHRQEKVEAMQNVNMLKIVQIKSQRALTFLFCFVLFLR